MGGIDDLVSFNRTNGADPKGSLAADASGNLYSTESRTQPSLRGHSPFVSSSSFAAVPERCKARLQAAAQGLTDQAEGEDPNPTVEKRAPVT